MQTPERFHRTVLLFLAFTITPVYAIDHERIVPRDADAEMESHQRALQEELASNHDAVKDLYQLLDATPQDDLATRQFIQGEMQRFDERNDVLFDKLDAIDVQRYQQQRRSELHLRVGRLEAEAVQLRKTKRFLPAVMREAKARDLRKALEDGSWKDLIRGKRPSLEKQPSFTSTAELVAGVQSVETETIRLRHEVRQLRELVEQLGKPSRDPVAKD